MREYVTFAQLEDAVRRCGNRPTVADCKGCAYNDSIVRCVVKMNSRAAQVIELFAAEELEGCDDIGKYKMD